MITRTSRSNQHTLIFLDEQLWHAGNRGTRAGAERAPSLAMGVIVVITRIVDDQPPLEQAGPCFVERVTGGRVIKLVDDDWRNVGLWFGDGDGDGDGDGEEGVRVGVGVGV